MGDIQFEQAKRWGEIMEIVRSLQYTKADKAEQYERERKQNIKERFDLLKKALATGYATDRTLQIVAELGAEFEEGKAYNYTGGSPFS